MTKLDDTYRKTKKRQTDRCRDTLKDRKLKGTLEMYADKDKYRRDYNRDYDYSEVIDHRVIMTLTPANSLPQPPSTLPLLPSQVTVASSNHNQRRVFLRPFFSRSLLRQRRRRQQYPHRHPIDYTLHPMQFSAFARRAPHPVRNGRSGISYIFYETISHTRGGGRAGAGGAGGSIGRSTGRIMPSVQALRLMFIK